MNPKYGRISVYKSRFTGDWVVLNDGFSGQRWSFPRFEDAIAEADLIASARRVIARRREARKKTQGRWT